MPFVYTLVKLWTESVMHGGAVFLFVCDHMKKSPTPPMHYHFSNICCTVTSHQDANYNKAKHCRLSHTCSNA